MMSNSSSCWLHAANDEWFLKLFTTVLCDLSGLYTTVLLGKCRREKNMSVFRIQDCVHDSDLKTLSKHIVIFHLAFRS